MELAETIKLMNSKDYKKRFVAEYWQTKIRYEKLKAFNTKIEAGRTMQEMTRYLNNPNEECKVKEPKHDCPEYMLKDQQRIMGEYLHILEVRAVIENVDLNETEAK